MCIYYALFFFFFKQKTAYEMRISDWSSDVGSSDLLLREQSLRRIERARLADRMAQHAVDEAESGEERDERHEDRDQRHQREAVLAEVEPDHEIGRATSRGRGCQAG